MNEASLKAALMLEIKKQLPGFVAFRHEDVRTAGIPDMSLTGLGKTSFWEFKHATPHFDSTGIQELTMLRLASAGYARYILWWERRDIKRTMIVHPIEIHERLLTPHHKWQFQPEHSTRGFDHAWLVERMREVHQCL